MAGTLGFLLILIAFVACGISGYSYFRAAAEKPDAADWLRIGRGAWVAVTASIAVSMGILMYLVITHQFQYGYVYEHSSLDLPLHFLISATWAGQEGSFMLWILFNCFVGLALLKWARDYEATTMTVVALCQFFLVSMVLGAQLGPLPIGASPFTTLAEKFPEAPMLRAGLTPTDGVGLNDLLQNVWMVIHPPTLFVGFSAMIVPFAFAVSALWKRRYTQWVRPAIPWTLAAVMILGVGIAMGGYWAYVTLSFGGYWAWDPVENSSLGPWLLGIAAVHTMIVQKRSGNSHKASLFLSIVAYMLVVYSTFLTRSGILGDVSVHSFVDLGLYNQLLIWILTMGVLGFGLFIYRYSELPTPTKEPNIMSREFMIFCGAMLITALAAMVIVGTSAPILGKIFRDSPSTVPIAFYNKWALPLSVGFVFLAGIGQLFWWNKMEVEQLNKVLFKPIALSVVSTVLVLVFTPFVERSTRPVPVEPEAVAQQAGLFGDYVQAYGTGLMMLLLVFVAFFALYGNFSVLWRLGKENPRFTGGAVAHVGFAILVLGIVASSGFSNPIGRGGLDLRQDGDRDNLVIEKGQTAEVGGYQVSYIGREVNDRGRPVYVLDFVEPGGASYRLKPVVYRSNNDQWIQHPDLKLGVRRDVFVAVTPNDMFSTDDSAEGGQLALAMGESAVVGSDEYDVHFVEFEMHDHSEFVTEATEIAVAAVVNVTNRASGETRTLKPLYLVDEDGSTRYVPSQVPEWEFGVSFVGMNVESGQINLIVDGAEVEAPDWIVVQAYEKPLIFLVWLGIILVSIGFLISIFRRVQDQRLAVDRGVA